MSYVCNKKEDHLVCLQDELVVPHDIEGTARLRQVRPSCSTMLCTAYGPHCNLYLVI